MSAKINSRNKSFVPDKLLKRSISPQRLRLLTLSFESRVSMSIENLEELKKLRRTHRIMKILDETEKRKFTKSKSFTVLTKQRKFKVFYKKEEEKLQKITFKRDENVDTATKTYGNDTIQITTMNFLNSVKQTEPNIKTIGAFLTDHLKLKIIPKTKTKVQDDQNLSDIEKNYEIFFQRGGKRTIPHHRSFT